MVEGYNDVMIYYCAAKPAQVRKTHAVERVPPQPYFQLCSLSFDQGRKNSKLLKVAWVDG